MRFYTVFYTYKNKPHRNCYAVFGRKKDLFDFLKNNPDVILVYETEQVKGNIMYNIVSQNYREKGGEQPTGSTKDMKGQ